MIGSETPSIPSPPAGPTYASVSPKPKPPRRPPDFVPAIEIVTWPGGPAPPEGSGSGRAARGIGNPDANKAAGLIKRLGKPGMAYDISHMKPNALAPPGEPQRFRVTESWKNRQEGPSIAKQAAENRTKSDHRDPTSPNYTRPKKPKKGSGKPGASATLPKPEKPPNAVAPEPMPGSTPPKPEAPLVGKPPTPTPPEAPVATKLLDPTAPKPAEPPLPGKPPPMPEPSPTPTPVGPVLKGLSKFAKGFTKGMSAVGEALIIRDMAREIEFRRDPGNPKWGTEFVDMFGRKWTKRSDGSWITGSQEFPDA